MRVPKPISLGIRILGVGKVKNQCSRSVVLNRGGMSPQWASMNFQGGGKHLCTLQHGNSNKKIYQHIYLLLQLETKHNYLTFWEPVYDILVLGFRPKNRNFRLPYQRHSSSPIALESCSRAQRIGQSSRLHLRKIFWLGSVDFLWLTS